MNRNAGWATVLIAMLVLSGSMALAGDCCPPDEKKSGCCDAPKQSVKTDEGRQDVPEGKGEGACSKKDDQQPVPGPGSDPAGAPLPGAPVQGEVDLDCCQ